MPANSILIDHHACGDASQSVAKIFLRRISMGTGFLLGGIACLLYALLVGYFGGIKKAPGLLKLVKMKLGKNMSDDAAAKACLIMSIIVLALGIFLFIYGGIRG